MRKSGTKVVALALACVLTTSQTAIMPVYAGGGYTAR